MAAGQESGLKPCTGSAKSLLVGGNLLTLFHVTSQKFLMSFKGTYNCRV